MINLQFAMYSKNKERKKFGSGNKMAQFSQLMIYDMDADAAGAQHCHVKKAN